MSARTDVSLLPTRFAHVLRIGLHYGGWRFAALAAIQAVTGTIPAATAWLLKRIIDALSAGGPAPALAELAWLAGVYVLADGSSRALSVLVTPIQGDLQRSVELNMQARVLDRLSAYPYLDVFDNRTTHNLTQAGTAAAARLPGLALGLALSSVRMVTSVVGFATLALKVTPLLGLGIGAITCLRLYEFLKANKIRDLSMVAAIEPTRRAQHMSQILASPRHAPEVRAFSLGSTLVGYFRHALGEVFTANRRAEWTEARLSVLSTAAEAVVAGGLLVWISAGALVGRFTAGDISFALSAMTALHGSAVLLIQQIGTVDEARRLQAHVRKLESRLAYRANGTSSARCAAEEPSQLQRIEFRAVRFRYGDNGLPWCLDTIDLQIGRGDKIGIVGRNGSGKTTLLKLLMGFYLPDEGEVLWDGASTRELDVTCRSSLFSPVFQDITRFDLTLREYVGMGCRGTGSAEARVRAALSSATCGEVLRQLPEGLDTFLSRQFGGDQSEIGVELSGVMWQRIAIARMYASTGDVLVLDEPTSAADLEYERSLSLRLREIASTVIVVTHRPALLEAVDRVIVLDRGRIVEDGPPHGLLTAKGPFAQVYRQARAN